MQLKDYLKGNRFGKDANRFERAAMNDPFLQEALDGFDTVPGNHVQIIEQLEKKFTYYNIGKKRKNLFWAWSSAASVLILVGLGIYYYFVKDYSFPMNQLAENKDVTLIADSVEEIIVFEESQTTELIVKPELKTEIPSASKTIIINNVENDIISEEVEYVENEFFVQETTLNVIAADEVFIEQDTNYPVAKSASNERFKEESKSTSKKQKNIIYGKVIDETGELIAGATIREKGTSNGVVTDIDGTFSMQITSEKSKLIASFIGLETQEFKPSDDEIIITLNSTNDYLSEVVVTGMLRVDKRLFSGATSKVKESDIQIFGEKEFQFYCSQNAEKNICIEQKIVVKVSFIINAYGQPTDINYIYFTCEEAKNEIDRLLSSSPAWTKRNRKVTMTVRWN